MVTLFGLDIAAEVNNAISAAGNIAEATLVKVTPGTRTPGQLSGGTNPTRTSHAARGIRESITRRRPETLLQDTRAIISLLGASIAGGAIPETGDEIIIEGETFTIIGPVERDPAAALYVCQVS